MLKLFLQISLLSISLMLFSCKDNPVNPAHNKTSVNFTLEKSNKINHHRLFGNVFPKVLPGFHSNEFLKNSDFDEMRIICLDMTKWNDIDEFWYYWDYGQQSELIDHSLWDSTKDEWDNYVLLLQRFPGDAFEFIADYGFTIKDSIASGTVFLNPGLNYFMYCFRKNGVTGSVYETDAYIVEDSTNNITLAYSNEYPDYPFYPHPPEFATGVVRDVILKWQCNDPDFDQIFYDVYFGTSTTFQIVAQGITSQEFIPGALLPSTTYFWRVDATDDHGNLSQGTTWQFTTGQ